MEFLDRLEAATSRLEDIAASQAGIAVPSAPAPKSAPSGAAAPAGSAPAESIVPPVAAAVADPPAVTGWTDYLEHSLREYSELSQTVGGLVAEQATHVVKAFAAQADLIKLAANCAKPAGAPNSPEFAKLLKPIQEALIAVTEIREKNRGERVLFNHLSAVSEGIPAVGWVAVVSTAAAHEHPVNAYVCSYDPPLPHPLA